jgi:MFS family permease
MSRNRTESEERKVKNQNSSVHIRLWHRDFWLMVVANFLLSASVTVLIPTFPLWMYYTEGLTPVQTGLAMGAFGIGLFLPGGLCSFLVQHYRRNMVCVWGVAVLAAMLLIPCRLHLTSPLSLIMLRMLQGAAFGLSQMVLVSTLIIDTCEAFQRTEGNHSVMWFGRFALSLGPMAGLLLYETHGFNTMLLVAAACCIATMGLILMVRFPFRVPADRVPLWSMDRFLLPSAWPLMCCLTAVAMAVGMLFALRLSSGFYGLMMVGFLLALLAGRFVFRDAEPKSEVVTGHLLTAAAMLIMLFSPQSPLAPPLLGLGIGIVGARFLLFFIKLSRHCQRGTAQSTFLLSWEGGLAFGIALGYMLVENRGQLLATALVLVVAAWVYYTTYLHQWFMRNKNRG